MESHGLRKDPTDEEWLEGVRSHIDAFFPRGAAPKPKAIEDAQREARNTLNWIRQNKTKDLEQLAQDFEHILFEIGSIRLEWCLYHGDRDLLVKYLKERHHFMTQQGVRMFQARNRAEHRQHEEHGFLFDIVLKTRMKAEVLGSKKLSEMADTIEQMHGFFRIEPDGPARIDRKKKGEQGARKRHTEANQVRRRYKGIYVDGKRKRKWKSAHEAARKLTKEIREARQNTGSPLRDRATQTISEWFREADKGNME